MEQSDACYTFEAAIELAVQMEEEGFRHYLNAIRTVNDVKAQEMLKEAALDELEHKHQLEKALLEGTLTGGLAKPVPTMNLDYVLAKKGITPNSDVRECLVFAIHLETESIGFYKRMVAGCGSAPMTGVFKKILADETRHLQSLEDLYDRHCMPEN